MAADALAVDHFLRVRWLSSNQRMLTPCNTSASQTDAVLMGFLMLVSASTNKYRCPAQLRTSPCRDRHVLHAPVPLHRCQCGVI